jgi:hypothetical protein
VGGGAARRTGGRRGSPADGAGGGAARRTGRAARQPGGRGTRPGRRGRGPAGGAEREGRYRMLTARAMTSAPTESDTADWTAIVSLAHRASGITSVGLNAVAFVNDR